MKRRFSKILGVGLTLALLASLILTAAPVSALGQANVTVDPDTISEVDPEYAIRFELDEQLTGGTTVTTGGGPYNLAGIGDSFIITATAGGVATITPATDTAVTVALSGGPTTTYDDTGPHNITFATDQTGTVTVATVDPADGSCTGSWSPGGATATAAVGVGAADTITIVFPSDTTIIDAPTATMVAGPGWVNGIWLDAKTPALASVVGTVDTRTVVITLPTTTSAATNSRIGEGAEVRLSFTVGITNPSNSGDYTLTVETSKEDTPVTSAPYTIKVPTIPGLPGVANVYNPVGILMAQENDLSDAVDAAGVDYLIEVGPGTYIDNIIIGYEGLTFVSTAGAATTIIEGTITINAVEVTVDGFTFDIDSGPIITVTGAGTDAIVQNNIITAEDGWPDGILLQATGATISGNELSINTTMMVLGAADSTLSDNTFGAGINIGGSTDITITGNDLTGAEFVGIRFQGGDSTDILIEGNTISEVTLAGALDGGIGFLDGPYIVTNLQIIGNDITDNEGVGIVIPDNVTLTDSVIKFNTITGNDADQDGYGLETNVGADDAVDATFNWWGTTVSDDIAAMINDTGLGDTTYDPFLTDTAEAVFSASDVGTGATLDAKDTVGVKVSGAEGATIAVAKYIANPQAAIADAIAFYDVYVAQTAGTPDVTIKFYAGDAQTKVYIWSADTETWGEVTPVDFSAYGGYVWFKIEPAMLAGTPFALVAGAAAEIGGTDDPLLIISPKPGERDIPLTPTFSWTQVAAADAYYFELADNANFVLPLVKMDGDLGRLIVTAYAHVEELPYSTAYYWRVKAVTGTVEGGDLGESAWATAVFITMDEPEEPVPPVVVEEAADLPDIVIEQPDIIVESPDVIVPQAEIPITPTWIYVIIAVGAVLVISVIVLIVRTRRVA